MSSSGSDKSNEMLTSGDNLAATSGLTLTDSVKLVMRANHRARWMATGRITDGECDKLLDAVVPV